ncbi:MAG: hypothetical protein AMXMBFR44_6330 [Candidatus Campbellbacteria bacterium]
MTPALVAYIPVIHQGYLELFAKYHDKLYVLGDDVLSLVPYIARDMRACKPETIVQMAQSLGFFRGVQLAGTETLKTLAKAREKVVMPDEDISREVAEHFFKEGQVEFAQLFLRWHQKNVASEQRPQNDRSITKEALHQHFIQLAYGEAGKSPDWWRQVGACAVREGRVVLAACNTHFPSQQTAYIIGDPRTPFSPGERIDVSLSGHAERLLIGEAAARGIRLRDCDLYVTTFPCPGCAIQVAVAGFRRIFYCEGYSLAGADEILRARGVELVRVEMT